MTDHIDEKRIGELRAYLRAEKSFGKGMRLKYKFACSVDLLSILSSYAALKAELAHAKEVAEGAGYRLANAEAELAKQAPLIQAVMNLGHEGGYYLDEDDIGIGTVIEAALALREKKGEKT